VISTIGNMRISHPFRTGSISARTVKLPLAASLRLTIALPPSISNLTPSYDPPKVTGASESIPSLHRRAKTTPK
jgi:hypothetical protein